jgi:hypothetical protein
VNYEPSISGDGRRVSFVSDATNIFPPGTYHARQVVVRDRVRDTLEVASVSSTGAPGDIESLWGRISVDGLHVAFMSRATNLVEDDGTTTWTVRARSRDAERPKRASVSSAGTEAELGEPSPRSRATVASSRS